MVKHMTPLWFLNVLGTLWIDPVFGILIPVIHWEGLWDRDTDRACCCRVHELLFCWQIGKWWRAPQGAGHLDARTDPPFAKWIEKKSLSSRKTSENRLHNVPRIPWSPEMASLKWKTRILIAQLWFPAIRYFENVVRVCQEIYGNHLILEISMRRSFLLLAEELNFL